MKLNLHSHLEGRLRPSTAAALAVEAGVSPPERGWERALQLDWPSNLTIYLSKVAATYPFFRSPAHVARIACEAVEDAAADGTDYLELRFGPATHAHTGFDMDSVMAAVCDGVAEGVHRTKIHAGVVIAALRHYDVDTNIAVARAASRYAGKGVVGFDLAGDESRFNDLAKYERPFAIARAAGLGLTCHAAEAAPGSAAREAAERFGVSRIGHGAHLAEDRESLGWMRDHGVVVECCPTSNWYTGAIASRPDHPARYFREQRLKIVLGDDNPIQTKSLLSNERRVLAEELGFNEQDLHTLDETSVSAAFVEDATRREFVLRLHEKP
ncbi:MAG TPA: adenosine deaminase [Candidatus Acidoferrales bacterium]|jgi:adenosine deaminase|nr:adenosine deaminase [Candidatus Acidoferrales bacterium]